MCLVVLCFSWCRVSRGVVCTLKVSCRSAVSCTSWRRSTRQQCLLHLVVKHHHAHPPPPPSHICSGLERAALVGWARMTGKPKWSTRQACCWWYGVAQSTRGVVAALPEKQCFETVTSDALVACAGLRYGSGLRCFTRCCLLPASLPGF